MRIDIKNIFGITTGGDPADKLDVKQVIEGPEEEPQKEETSEAKAAEQEQAKEETESVSVQEPEVEGTELAAEAEAILEEAGEAENSIEADEPETLEASEITEEPEITEEAEADTENADALAEADTENVDAVAEAGEVEDPSDMQEETDELKEDSGDSEGSEEADAAEEADDSEKDIEEEDDSEESAEQPAETEVSSEESDEPEGPSEGSEPAKAPPAEQETPRKQVFPSREKLLALGRSYGWMAGIAAAFAFLMAFMVIYTTMIPRDITVTLNGEDFTFTTKEHTVQGFLEAEGIDFCEEDYISIPTTAFIQNGLNFEIKHATVFTVTADGKIRLCKTLDNTVEQALDDVGIKVGKLDIVTPSLDTLLKKDMRITIQRVAVKKETVEEKIPYKTVNRDDTSMDEGTTKVVTEGQDGKDKVTYEITYVDGKETSRKEVSREAVTAVVDEVVAIGTRVNYNGQTYSRKLVVKAYAYTGGGITAMGTRARVGEIAVDPSVIPLGTNVYIEGVGARRAEDTGGNIKGNTIDIYMNTQSECLNWGVRYVTIYIQ